MIRPTWLRPASGRSEIVDIALAARRGLFLLIPAAAFLALGSQVPHFLDLSNLLNVVRQSSITGICAVGMTFVIVIKGYRPIAGRSLGVLPNDERDLHARWGEPAGEHRRGHAGGDHPRPVQWTYGVEARCAGVHHNVGGGANQPGLGLDPQRRQFDRRLPRTLRFHRQRRVRRHSPCPTCCYWLS